MLPPMHLESYIDQAVHEQSTPANDRELSCLTMVSLAYGFDYSVIAAHFVR
jgi:hypothetical protein